MMQEENHNPGISGGPLVAWPFLGSPVNLEAQDRRRRPGCASRTCVRAI